MKATIKNPRSPTDESIIRALTTTYGVDRAVVIGWLRTMDLTALERAA